MPCDMKFPDVFFKRIGHPSFRGLAVFSTVNTMEAWQNLVCEVFIKKGGMYLEHFKEWKFPWGATLRLLVYDGHQTVKAVRGHVYSDIEMDYTINDDELRMQLTLLKRLKF